MRGITLGLLFIFCIQLVANAQAAEKITFPRERPKGPMMGGKIAQHFGTGGQKNDNSPMMFFKNGQSAGLEFTIVPPKGTTRYKLTTDYIMGNNDNNAIAAFAKENRIEYTSYKFTIPKPRGFAVMVSPQFMLFPKSQNKKLPLMWLDLQAGAFFSNKQTLQFFQGQSATPSKEIKSNAVSFVYNPTLVVNVVKTKKLFLNLRAGYSSFGGFGVGVGITESDCRGAPCCKCPFAGCNSCGSSLIESINN
jgi:hypothetical protein